MSNLRDIVFGPRPSHVHRNSNGDLWQCNSPYCEDVASTVQDHPDDGGLAPIIQGREPWRGR